MICANCGARRDACPCDSRPLFDFGFEAVEEFEAIAFYGPIYLVEFRDYTRVIVIEDPKDSPDANYVVRPASAWWRERLIKSEVQS